MKTLALFILVWGITINHLPVERPQAVKLSTTVLPTSTQHSGIQVFPVLTSSTRTNHSFINVSDLSALNGATCASTALLRKQMVDLINHARSKPRVCGMMHFEVAPPVRWNYSLEKAAKLHSHKMATQNFFAHRGPDSTHVGIRVQKVGYNWRFVGENIYAGIETVTEAVYGWLESEGHCKTIKNPDYTELGAACVSNTASQYESYWTQVFTSPM